GQTQLGKRTEIKNLNSFRFLQKALEYEVNRHIQILESGGEVVTETLLWNEREEKTYAMRTKEESSDYRYFPEPDLLPLIVSEEQIERAKSMVGELPAERIARFEREYSLEHDVAVQLCARKDISDYADEVLTSVEDKKGAANWILTELARILNERNWKISQFPVPPENLADLLKKLEQGKISRPIAKDLFRKMVDTKKTAEDLIKEMGIQVISDRASLESVVDQVIAENPDAVEKFKKGKTNIVGFFVGQVMKKTRGQADPKVVNQIVLDKLKTS
ncbi:MAG TPA: Asp-tRNA(Asn)/Glu-tRNA(Gln) amidotransferase GatCAB subunit B, partial [candidate division Zixibacteria bacterium]|nr:Asp-tRNA(Asn)/Glu-tRNA(Gln) amidotransferase GatCAB subunit B [candidate division Zixibacteria bacterium]